MPLPPLATIDPWALLALLGSAQGLLLVLAIGSTKRVAEPAGRVLVALLFAGALAGGSIALAHSGLVSNIILIELFETAVTLTTGPLLLLFVLTSLGSAAFGRGTRRYWLQFLPALVWTCYVGVQTAEIQLRGGTALPLFMPPIELVLLHQMTYTGLAFYAWLRADRNDDTARPSKRQLLIRPRPLLLMFLALHFVQLTRYSLRHFPGSRNVVPLGLALAFAALTFVLVRHALAGTNEKARYAASKLQPDRAADIERRLLDALETDGVFRDPGLNVTRMAAKLHVPQTQLSQVVNQRLDKSFAELIADYRVRAAERLLADPASADRTVEAIGQEAGFLSRSTFYEAFKRQTGETPSAFRRRKRPQT